MRAVLLIAPVAAVLIGGASWLRLRLLVVTVQGQSMAPTYAHGDRVLVRRARPGRLRAGQVVVVDLPVDMRPAPAGVGRAEAVRQRRVIKRVAAVSGEAVPAAVPAATATVPAGRMALLGDNPDASGDSRMYGLVPLGSVVGVVVRRMVNVDRRTAVTGPRPGGAR